MSPFSIPGTARPLLVQTCLLIVVASAQRAEAQQPDSLPNPLRLEQVLASARDRRAEVVAARERAVAAGRHAQGSQKLAHRPGLRPTEVRQGGIEPPLHPPLAVPGRLAVAQDQQVVGMGNGGR